MKVKVCELATGNQYLEEWKVFPDSWPHEFATVIDTIFNKNFVLLEIYDDSTDEIEADRFFILNLVTRKRFSIGRESLEETIFSLLDEVDGLSVDMEIANIEKTKVYQMVVGTNQIEIKHHTRISFKSYLYSGVLFIGQFWTKVGCVNDAASSRWSSLYCLIRDSDEIIIGKGHPLYFLRCI